MDFIRWAINRPVSVTVGVILIIMFGLVGLMAIPVQLTPTVDRPIVTVTTNWPGRTPQEIVDNITREQEKRLKNVTNLKRMVSTSTEGQASVELEFYVGADKNRSLQEVSDALRQVPKYPEEVDEPIIKAAEGASENASAWMIVDIQPDKLEKHKGYDISTLYDALDKEVKPYLERIDGVAEVNIYGGREREVRVLLDPVKLAQRRLTYLDVITALRGENKNASAGTISEGKRDYRVRVVGQFVTAEDVLNTIVAYRAGSAMGEGAVPSTMAPLSGGAPEGAGTLKPIYVRDLGTVEIGHQKVRGFVRSMGQPCIAMNCIRQTGANVVQIMRDLRARLKEVDHDILHKLGGDVGPDLRLRLVYDETTYIDSAIGLVTEALWIGGLLAGLVLLVFLRSWVATGIISLAIPISVIGTFLVMLALGRTLNVISLAGLAFATGMVVDDAIVVLENTMRRLRMGEKPAQAAYWGAKEVWSAVLASTLTTVAVFIPMLTIQEEAGQLFRDLALAISCSMLLSVVVSITVIPTAAARVLRTHVEHHERGPIGKAFETAFGLAPGFQWLVERLGDFVHWLMTGWRAWTVRPAIIIVMAMLSLWGSLKLAPPLDYLPKGNQNLVFGGLLIPPGYSVDQQEKISNRLEAVLQPYVEADIHKPETVAKLKPIFRFDDPAHPFDPVPIEQFFIGSFGGTMFVGATSQDPQRVIPIASILTNEMNQVPDAFGGAGQTSIFGRGIGSGSSVNVEISGPSLERVTAAAQQLFMSAAMKHGYTFRNVQPNPTNFNLSQPEWTVRVNRLGRELGLSSQDVGIAVRALFDGAFVDDFRLGADTVDLMVVPTGGRLEYKERLHQIPIATPSGRVVQLDQVVDITETRAPQQIRRMEELPGIGVQITPRQNETVEQVMANVREKMLPELEQAGLLDATMRVRLEGTAASLDQVRASLFGKPRTGPLELWQKVLIYVAIGLSVAGTLVGFVQLGRAWGRRHGHSEERGRAMIYGFIGIVLLSLIIGGLISGVAWQPQLATARTVWSVAVTYLLMCSLFESFMYPLVIMFSVPLAIVGGFAGLRIAHDWTVSNPTIAPQQLDVLTMIGFIILIGTVVKNAILLVEQALNFEDPSRYGGAGEKMPMLRAVRASIVSRVRPIFMTTLTTIGGMLPLVVAPGAGSEMYRGLGAVVLGGLIVSTVFTLVLVPLVFSLAAQMRAGAIYLLTGGGAHATHPLAGPDTLPTTPAPVYVEGQANGQTVGAGPGHRHGSTAQEGRPMPGH